MRFEFLYAHADGPTGPTVVAIKPGVLIQWEAAAKSTVAQFAGDVSLREMARMVWIAVGKPGVFGDWCDGLISLELVPTDPDQPAEGQR